MSNMADEIYGTIKQMICETCNRTELDGTESLFDDLHFDSVEIISLVVDIEKKYHIQPKEYDKLFEVTDNVDSFVRYFVDRVMEEMD